VPDYCSDYRRTFYYLLLEHETMKTEAIYGTIVFTDAENAIIQHIASRETINADSNEDCEDIAEHNAGYYGGDWIIPDFYKGRISWECLE